jgi:hypothetical protein
MSASDSLVSYVRSPDLVAADMDGDTVMMSIERGEYFGIGGVGSRVWQLLEHPLSIKEIVRAVCAEFDVDEATCQADMIAFIGELQAHRLISTVPR